MMPLITKRYECAKIRILLDSTGITELKLMVWTSRVVLSLCGESGLSGEELSAGFRRLMKPQGILKTGLGTLDGLMLLRAGIFAG